MCTRRNLADTLRRQRAQLDAPFPPGPRDNMPQRFWFLAVFSLARWAAATIPSFSDAINRCASASTHTATCQPLPSSSVCAHYYAPGQSVYIPTGMTMDDIETIAISDMGTSIINKGFLYGDCFNFSLSFTCNSHFFRCLPSGNDSEPLPLLPCADYCASFWEVRCVCARNS